MAIVKMTEFQCYVLNEELHEVLCALQAFKNVTFKDISDQEDTPFLAAKTDYDFEKNQYQQDHIKQILASFEKYAKMQKRNKKNLSNNFGVMQLTYQELQQRAETIDIEFLLTNYDENYDAQHSTVEGFETYRPWNNQRIDGDKLEELLNSKIIIGTVDKDKYVQFEKDLLESRLVFFMKKESGSEMIYVIKGLDDDKERIDIAADKVDFNLRSAKSLHITQEVALMEASLENLIEKRQTMDARYGNIGHFLEELKIYYEYLRNEEYRYQMISRFLQSDHITVFSGFIETDRVDEFESLIESVTKGISHVSLTKAASDSREVPIKLNNNRIFRPFELITNMYSQPRYNELDPTPFLMPFYALFFGMMLADVGYGLLMGILTFTALKLINMKQSTKQMMTFLMILSVPTIIWGCVYGSFFGGLIPMRGLLDVQRDFNFVMVISLAFGVVHLFFGLALKGYLYLRDHKPWYVLFDVVFWYAALIGAIVLVSGMFTDVLKSYNSIAMILMIAGMAGIVLTNGREAKTIPGKFASGLYSLYGMTNYVGDIVSYTRLMALGLAGASIGMAFNLIVQMVSKMGIFGILGGALIFMIGHGFNMFISGLSAYVHSARLTYVEFFGKFYVGGGKPFIDFRAKPTYIEIA